MTSAKKGKYKEVIIPIYNGYCWMYSGDMEACEAHFRSKHNGPKELFNSGRLGACYVDNNDFIVAIYIKKHNNYPTLAHEILHATIHIMNQAGISLSESSEEAYAYFVSFLFEEWVDRDKWEEL